MGNDKHTSPKPNATMPAQATPAAAPTNQGPKEHIAPASLQAGAVKTDSEAIKSTSSAADASEEIKLLKSASDAKRKSSKDANVPSKMEIATEIYTRMMQTKGMTRKEVLEQFVAQAKLSKAGASTYFQLIKAKG